MIQVVCIKQVADTETRVKVAADGKSLDPAGVTWILNPYDEFAIEQALQIKEAGAGGEVIALSVGGAGVQTTLRNALAMGADRAIHLKSDAPGDPLAVAQAIAAELAPLNPALVWFGKQAVDDDAAQVGPMVATLLGQPCVTGIAKYAAGDGGKATVEREIEGGRELVEVTFPAVLTADKGLNTPRYASLKGIMAAKKKTIEEKPAALGEPGLEVRALEMPAGRGAGRIVGEGSAAIPELIRVLREEAKVI